MCLDMSKSARSSTIGWASIAPIAELWAYYVVTQHVLLRAVWMKLTNRLRAAAQAREGAEGTFSFSKSLLPQARQNWGGLLNQGIAMTTTHAYHPFLWNQCGRWIFIRGGRVTEGAARQSRTGAASEPPPSPPDARRVGLAKKNDMTSTTRARNSQPLALKT